MNLDYFALRNMTPEEQKQYKYDIMFREGSYSTKTGIVGSVSDLFDLGIAYRADSREQYLKDATGVLVESGVAYLTGGSSMLVRTAIKRITELVEDPYEVLPSI